MIGVFYDGKTWHTFTVEKPGLSGMVIVVSPKYGPHYLNQIEKIALLIQYIQTPES